MFYYKVIRHIIIEYNPRLLREVIAHRNGRLPPLNLNKDDLEEWEGEYEPVICHVLRSWNEYEVDISDLVDCLIQAGAKVDEEDNKAMALAVDYDLPSVVQSLLKAGASPNAIIPRDNQRVLSAALWSNYDDISRLLLQAGADPSLLDGDGHDDNALHCASRNFKDDPTVVKEHFDKFSHLLDVPNHNGETPIFAAIEVNNIEMLRFLVDQGANLTVFAAGYTPLQYALLHHDDNIATAIYLLTRGVDPNGVFGGMSYLNYACTKGYCDVAVALLDAGADPWITNGQNINVSGDTALLCAARKGIEHIVQKIIELHPQLVDTRNHLGRTPLMEAAIAGNVEVMRILLGAGANVTAIDDGGKTAIDFAVEFNKHECEFVLMCALQTQIVV